MPSLGIKAHDNIVQGSSFRLELGDDERKYIFHVDGESYLVSGRHVIEVEYNGTINVMRSFD